MTAYLVIASEATLAAEIPHAAPLTDGQDSAL